MLLCKPAMEKSSSKESNTWGTWSCQTCLVPVDPECSTLEMLHLILIKIFRKTQDTPTFLGSFTLSHPNKMHSGLGIALPHTWTRTCLEWRVVINFLQSVTLKKNVALCETLRLQENTIEFSHETPNWTQLSPDFGRRGDFRAPPGRGWASNL